jgi:peptide-methionine (S)-S-oxide reductase
MISGAHGRVLGALVAAAALLLSCGPAAPAGAFPDPPPDGPGLRQGVQTAVLSGGCFWGMEGLFERLKGVQSAESGYAGGDEQTASYEMVSTGTTGHAESVRITYDPSVISYGMLLKIFFSVAHNPTQLNYQGPDHGTQYRSAIFYSNDDQRKVAEAYIEDLTRRRIFARPIVTQVAPLAGFYPAEQYHQHFMERNPDYPYIVIYDRPKVLALEREYGTLLAQR